jgi:hypothetical protein
MCNKYGKLTTKKMRILQGGVKHTQMWLENKASKHIERQGVHSEEKGQKVEMGMVGST